MLGLYGKKALKTRKSQNNLRSGSKTISPMLRDTAGQTIHYGPYMAYNAPQKRL